MQRIDTSFAASGQPWLAPTSLDMLQDAYKNGIRELALAQIGSSYSTSVPYILWGCESVSPVAVSEGGIFFNGEVFYTAGWSSGSLPPSPLVLIANISTNFAAIDPVTFEDGSTHNVHALRTCIFSYGTSGTGTIGDFTDFVRVNTTSVDYSVIGANIGTRTIEMERNKFIEFNGVGSAATVTIDATKAISGRVVEFRTATGTAGHTIDFTGVFGTSPVAVGNSFPYTLTANKSIFVRMKAIEVGAATFFVYIEIYEQS
jgi:hypothetical protein